ncbi:MAG: phosphohistidine phosphatase SixA [Candidatus Binataceae bacterium]
MKLYLVRHAIAEDRSPSTEDKDRALTENGKARMMRATEGLRKMKIRPGLILTSPLRRAHETAEILANGLAGVKIEIMPELEPGVEASAAVHALHQFARLKSVALVGHEPGLGHLASFLLTGTNTRVNVDFKKGGVACIDAELDESSTHCTLKWMVTPKLLRSI